MEDEAKLIEFRQPERIECPACGGHNVRTTVETETFTYGDGPEAAELTARVPVMTCNDCGFQFTDEVAEEARHEAVCHHLGVMTPRKIREIRKLYRMSRAEFSHLTRIGEASLARWENSLLIQSPAYDQLLYLLTFPENVERLKSRRHGDQLSLQHNSPSQNRNPGRRGEGLRALRITDEEIAAAYAFVLRPTGT